MEGLSGKQRTSLARALCKSRRRDKERSVARDTYITSYNPKETGSWGTWGEDLVGYVPRLSFKQEGHTTYGFNLWIREEILKAKQEGRTLKILDVGGGPLIQWKELLDDPELSPHFELHASSLTNSANAEMKKRLATRGEVAKLGRVPAGKILLRLAHAAQIDEKFPNNLDVIVSHCGMHDEELPGLKAAHKLLAPGGQMLLQATGNCPRSKEKLEPYEIVKFEPATRPSTTWAAHLRKR